MDTDRERHRGVEGRLRRDQPASREGLALPTVPPGPPCQNFSSIWWHSSPQSQAAQSSLEALCDSEQSVVFRDCLGIIS